MDLVTVSGIIVSAVGVLILSMAGLIKGMMVRRIEDMQKQMSEGFAALNSKVDEVQTELHHVDKRVAVIEAEHRLLAGRKRCSDVRVEGDSE